jgi:formylglycine-generating enzyme required for sulfatase activity
MPKKPDKSLPPPKGAGKYAGKEAKKWEVGLPANQLLKTTQIRFNRPARWEALTRISNGLYDMGGNVWQWCLRVFVSISAVFAWQGANSASKYHFSLVCAEQKKLQ